MIRAEYLRFLQTLNSDSVPLYVRKIANLVIEQLATLIPLSHSHGQRVKKVVELAQARWATISADIQPIVEQPAEQICSVTQLKSLSVGPFRGFAKQEDFDLTSQLVLIYGPNGTGKSSFCEALEYGLLGNVAEAENRRFRDQQDYMKNAHTKTFTAPTLIGSDSQGQDILMAANEALYRFCFVEKNRIDNFSRIAAQLPAKQTELISTLFGLDAFTEFIRNFTLEIDDRYIDLQGVNAKQLQDKRLELAGFQQQLATVPEELQKLDGEEKELANQYREDCSFAMMVSELNGDEGSPGLIQKLDTELQQPLAIKSDLTAATLQNLKEAVRSCVADLTAKQQALSAASQQLSFQQLYDAVTQVQSSSPEQCPACQTPLTQVAVNPYTHAGEALQKLQHLSKLQQDAKSLEEKIGKLLTDLSQIINTCCTRFQGDNQLSPLQLSSGESAKIDWWNSLNQQLDDERSPWQHVETQVTRLEAADKAIDQATQQRTEKQAELKRIRQFAEEIVKLQTRRKTANDSVAKAKEAINKFDTENAKLIADVEAEKPVVTQNQAIANAYSTFVQELNTYNNGLPSKLVADLGDTVVRLYNAFNRHDGQHEQLSAVHLPLSQNQRLEISFQNDPATFFDALHILSEGHIRCIGLSILTAKNIKENCPLLIFDDPVNAIDDDHRESIRRTLFEDNHFTSKQMILTCHGEEFFKDIHNLLGNDRSAESKSFTFLPRLDEQHIRIDYNCAPRNYILAAQVHMGKLEVRDALSKARKALEAVTKDKLWDYVTKYGDGNLSIKLRSATAPIDLRNLTEQLRSKITKADFSHDNKGLVATPLETLLGVSGDSREWRYLNKGTHEENDRAEFDRSVVESIIQALAELDSTLSQIAKG